MASNVQAGTRGLSAADWTRLKRIHGAAEFQTSSNKTRNGSSIIEFPASNYTDFVALNTADFITPFSIVTTPNGLGTANGISISGIGKTLAQTRLCNCTLSLLPTKLTGCAKCKNGL